MQRHTPIIATLLAPVALYALWLLWSFALVPLYILIWYGDTALQYRLSSDNVETRTRALKSAMSRRPASESKLESIVNVMQTDIVADVRSAAAHTLGQIGSAQPLPVATKQALSDSVLTSVDDATLSAAVKAVGHSAAHNQYPDNVVQRIAAILNEPHLPWVYSASIEALGKTGAAQALSDSVFTVMHTVFMDVERQDIRESLARAYAEIAAGQSLPLTTLDALADALENERNERIRIQAIYALAHASADYPPAKDLIVAITQDKTKQNQSSQLRSAAQRALRMMEHKQNFADREPMSVALDGSVPVKARLQAIRIIRSSLIKPASYDQVLSLGRDDDPRVAAAGIELFHFIATSPTDDFDKHSLIPQLYAALSDPNPELRAAAFGALSKIFVHRPSYRRSVDDFRPQIDAGMEDTDAKVRLYAMAALLRSEPGTRERDAILTRALNDSSPFVRRSVTSWIGYPGSNSKQRQALFAKAQQDPDESVRKAAVKAQKRWESSQGKGLKQFKQLWQSGEYSKLGMLVLTYATIAAPLLVGGIFLLYYMSRLLTYLGQRRWRALAVVTVITLWGAASYGMFLLYFLAGHAGSSSTREMLQLAGILWGAIAVYAALGWGMHYVVRR